MKNQDSIGPDFGKIWWDWAHLNSESHSIWNHFYPTAGASEALREVINELSAFQGFLIVFEGEYEGYEQIASGHSTLVVKINRATWREDWKQVQKNLLSGKYKYAQWWVSEPSAINGCFWPEFNDWISEIGSDDRIEIWCDLTYRGLTVDIPSYPKIHPQWVTGCIFSLSKPFGVYYRRIGGCYSRRPVTGLWGNIWFKNIDSIELGKTLLYQYPCGYFARKYQSIQHHILSHWNAQYTSILQDPHSVPLYQPSDVILLGYPAFMPESVGS